MPIQQLFTGGGNFIVDSADFDGTNDYMVLGAGLTGAADSKSGIFSCWVRLDGGNAAEMEICNGVTLLGGSFRRFTARRMSTNVFNVLCNRASDGTAAMQISTSGTYTSAATWLHVLASWDVSTVGARSLYINDVSDLVENTFVDTTLDYTVADVGVGALPSAGSKLNGALAELYFAPGQYLDFSVVANRRKFISSALKPVYMGIDGAGPTGTAPLVYQHLNDGEAVSNFATNRGTGGNFTITGTLDTGSTSPSD